MLKHINRMDWVWPLGRHGGQNQEFKAILCYTLNCRPAWATWDQYQKTTLQNSSQCALQWGDPECAPVCSPESVLVTPFLAVHLPLPSSLWLSPGQNHSHLFLAEHHLLRPARDHLEAKMPAPEVTPDKLPNG